MNELIDKYRQQALVAEKEEERVSQRLRQEKEMRLEEVKQSAHSFAEPYLRILREIGILELFSDCFKDVRETAKEKSRAYGIGTKPNWGEGYTEGSWTDITLIMVDLETNRKFDRKLSKLTEDIDLDKYSIESAKNVVVGFRWFGIGWGSFGELDQPSHYRRVWSKEEILCEISGDPDNPTLTINELPIPLEKGSVAERIAQLYIQKDIDRRRK